MTIDPHIWTCAICGDEVDDRRTEPYTEVTGWERRRDQGGTNALALRKPTGRAMCSSCMERMKMGLAPGQLSLT